MTVIDFTAFIGRLATASGDTILPFFRTSLSVENKNTGRDLDPVTEADRAAIAAAMISPAPVISREIRSSMKSSNMGEPPAICRRSTPERTFGAERRLRGRRKDHRNEEGNGARDQGLNL